MAQTHNKPHEQYPFETIINVFRYGFRIWNIVLFENEVSKWDCGFESLGRKIKSLHLTIGSQCKNESDVISQDFMINFSFASTERPSIWESERTSKSLIIQCDAINETTKKRTWIKIEDMLYNQIVKYGDLLWNVCRSSSWCGANTVSYPNKKENTHIGLALV